MCLLSRINKGILGKGTGWFVDLEVGFFWDVGEVRGWFHEVRSRSPEFYKRDKYTARMDPIVSTYSLLIWVDLEHTLRRLLISIFRFSQVSLTMRSGTLKYLEMRCMST